MLTEIPNKLVPYLIVNILERLSLLAKGDIK